MKIKLLFLFLFSFSVILGCSSDNTDNVSASDVLESTSINEEGVDYGMEHYTEESIDSANDAEILAGSAVPAMPSEYTETSFKELKDLAGFHDAEAQKRLDEMFTVTNDLANQGNAEAQNLLGVMYDNEIYETINSIESYILAREWFRKSADQGNDEAQFNLGTMYFYGRGSRRQDYITGRELYIKAANQGNISALNTLGELYFQGASVKQSYPTAMEWFKKSCDNGDETGCSRYETVAGWAQ